MPNILKVMPEFIHELAKACALLADGRRKISLRVCASMYCSKFSTVSALVYLLYKFTFTKVALQSTFRECLPSVIPRSHRLVLIRVLKCVLICVLICVLGYLL